MPRYAFLLEYDGSRFCGFQRQQGQPTVQQFLEETAAIFLKHPVLIHCAGRTDTGVHALGQVVHCDTPEHIDCYRFRTCLNYYGQPLGVSVIEIVQVPDIFHARFSAIGRSYLYIILNRSSPSSLFKGRCTHVTGPLDVHAMCDAAQKLEGHHNFESFRSAHCQASNAMRTLDTCTLKREGHFILAHLRSRSFLHNQVRIIMGTLIHIGLNRKPVSWIDTLLERPDRTQAGPTAPAEGLYFKNVHFVDKIFQHEPSLLMVA